jgi:UDP-glucose 4-epimerase
MNILITGAAGFIGSHIADKLVDEGHLVIGLDDLSSGKLENVNKQVAFFQLDLSQIETLFERFEIDLVIHCAAQTDVRVSIDDPIFDAMENIFGSLSVLEAMKKFGCERIIFFSSGGAVYSPENEYPLTEDSEIGPLSPYGISKYTIENYVKFYMNMHGLKAATSIVRLSNVYGPRNEKGIINLALNKFKKGETLELYGGAQTRDYIHVSDVVSAIDIIIKNNFCGVYNIGTGIETSLNDLMDLIIDGNKEWDKLVVHKEAIKGELQRSCLDSSMLLGKGCWTPKIDLKTGIDMLR